MSRQCLRDESLDFMGCLDEDVEFTPLEIESVVKTYGNYKRYVLKIRN